MAARKTRQPSADDSVPDQPEVSAPEQPVAATRQRLPLFWVSASVFALWFALLSTLAVTTANPVTFNRKQIRSADLVVEALVEDVEEGRCRSVATWPASDGDGMIVIADLASLPAVPGKTYFFPLVRTEVGEAYEVVRTPSPESARLIYPVPADVQSADDARRQIDEIFSR